MNTLRAECTSSNERLMGQQVKLRADEKDLLHFSSRDVEGTDGATVDLRGSRKRNLHAEVVAPAARAAASE